MAKKAKCDVICGDEKFEGGKVYPNEAVAHLDQADFDEVPDTELGAVASAEKPAESAEGKVEGDASSATVNNDSTEVELVDHEVSQEDLDANPELVAEGVQVGDIIKLPKTDADLE